MNIQERFAALASADEGDAACEPYVIERGSGTLDDYQRLAQFHYRGGPPATCVGTWMARCLPTHRRDACATENQLIGVLVVSMPVLNGSWRTLAWPGRYDTPDKRENAQRLNAEVRCISRVVVHPRWRGMGVAKALVAAYLREPLTRRTEAVAAMGAASPFFKAAGMREHALPPRARDAALITRLRQRGIAAWQLGDVRRCAALARHDGMLEGALRAWAGASKSTSREKDASVRRLVRLAAQSVACQPRAYTWEGRP